MRRHSRIRRAARRRRLAATMVATLFALAAVLVHCQTTAPPTDTEASEQGAREYDSVDRGDGGGERAQSRRELDDSGSARNRGMRPSNHTVDWIERHGPVARANANDCTSCHQEEDCASCHTEEVSQPFRVHPPNYETIHARDARLDMDECTECHTVETFCAECHARHGVSANEPHDPPTHMEFHPPGWLDASSPENHGVAARRNINECASCHQERDCVTCHQGINPHPPEFRLECDQWLRADPRPCAQCHGDVHRLDEMCL